MIHILYLLVTSVLVTCVVTSPSSKRERDASTQATFHKGKNGAVASLSSVCSRIGIALIESGGSAADAMVGTQLCLGVITMEYTGLGGGGFMLVRSSNSTYEFIDFRETAPAAAFETMYNGNINASIFGGLASGVPGDLRGLEHLHNGYGNLPWADVVRPAVKVARNGFVVSKDLVDNMNSLGPKSFLSEDPNWAIDFAPNGTRVGVGDILTRKRYADLLENIADKGPNVFYTGAIAETMIAAIQAANGTMTMGDLQNYKVKIRQPAEITYRGYRITSCSAPSGGTVALNAMKTVEGYSGFGDATMINLTTHRFDEAIRFAYGARARLGDPSFLSNMTVYQQEMLADNTAAEIRSKISDFHTLAVSAYDPNGLESLQTPGTSHAVTADANGMAISLTSTVNLLFGSQLLIPETGLIMNNEMNDFSVPGASNAFGYIPSPANYIRPGKRPLSSITPVIVEHLLNRSLYFAVGAAGGSRIITTTLQNLWHVLDQNMTSIQALKSPRFHDQLIPNQMVFEVTYNNQTTASMREKGHNVTWITKIATAQALRRLSNGTFEAAGEPRAVDSGGYVL